MAEGACWGHGSDRALSSVPPRGGTCSIQQPTPREEAGALSHWDGPGRGQLVGKDSWGSQGQATRLQGSYRQGRREEISKTWPADWSPREHTPPGPGGMSLTVP